MATLTEALAAYFCERPGVWLDGLELAPVGGAYAWRSQVSRLRRAPFRMVIENRQRRVEGAEGAVFIVSEYCYVPPVAPGASPAWCADAVRAGGADAVLPA